MIPLTTQIRFEELYRDKDAKGRRSHDGLFIIYFTAKWCKPCARLDKDEILRVATEKSIPCYICVDEENDYTPGYCGVNRYPTFIACQVGKIISRITSSKQEEVMNWLDLI